MEFFCFLMTMYNFLTNYREVLRDTYEEVDNSFGHSKWMLFDSYFPKHPLLFPQKVQFFSAQIFDSKFENAKFTLQSLILVDPDTLAPSVLSSVLSYVHTEILPSGPMEAHTIPCHTMMQMVDIVRPHYT